MDRDDEAKLVILDWNKTCQDYDLPNITIDINHRMPLMVESALKVGLLVLVYKKKYRLELRKRNYENFCKVAEDKQSHLYVDKFS